MFSSNVARVLVVDDEPELRELLTDALSADGIQVRAAGSGKEAIALAKQHRPDIVVTDVRLGDCTGLEVIDRLRASMGDIPAVVITGYGDAKTLSDASRRRPVELMTKPLDVGRLQETIRQELSRQAVSRRLRERNKRLRGLAREANRQRKSATRQLHRTCEDLTCAYRTLSGQMGLQKIALAYQRELIGTKTDDDVFRELFSLFAQRSGPVFGVALVCDSSAELQLIGRFGVPAPDSSSFCQLLSVPMADLLLVSPQVMLIDAGQQSELFDEAIRKYLVGVSVLAAPLLPTEGEMIGLVVFYRKGEQPFTDSDIALAEMIALPTALAIRRNG